jgi:hypothetical protein
MSQSKLRCIILVIRITASLTLVVVWIIRGRYRKVAAFNVIEPFCGAGGSLLALAP